MRHIFESYSSGPDLPDDPFHPFTPDECETHTATHMRTYLIQHLSSPLGPNPGPSVPHPDLQVINRGLDSTRCLTHWR